MHRISVGLTACCICSFLQRKSYSSGLGDILESPLQLRLHLPGFMQWPPRASSQAFLHRLTSVFSGITVQNSITSNPHLPCIIHAHKAINTWMVLTSPLATLGYRLSSLDHSSIRFGVLTLKKHLPNMLLSRNKKPFGHSLGYACSFPMNLHFYKLEPLGVGICPLGTLLILIQRRGFLINGVNFYNSYRHIITYSLLVHNVKPPYTSFHVKFDIFSSFCCTYCSLNTDLNEISVHYPQHSRNVVLLWNFLHFEISALLLNSASLIFLGNRQKCSKIVFLNKTWMASSPVLSEALAPPETSCTRLSFLSAGLSSKNQKCLEVLLTVLSPPPKPQSLPNSSCKQGTKT